MRNKTLKVALKYALIIGLFIAVGSQINGFLTFTNLLNVTRQSAATALCVVGVSVVIISGNGATDLSIPGIYALTPTVCCLLMRAGVPVLPAILVALAASTFIGFVDGFLVENISIPAFISSYVIGQIASGIALVVSQGQSFGGFSGGYTALGNGYVLGLPVPTIFMIIFVACGCVLMNKTTLGKHIYALGGSEMTVRYEGIDKKKIHYFTFAFSAFCTGMAGILTSAQLNAVQPTIGANSLLDAVAAAGIGGVNMLGGEGKIWEAMLGALFMGCLRNALTLLGMEPYFQNLFIGTIIIVIVAVSVTNKNRTLEKSKVF